MLICYEREEDQIINMHKIIENAKRNDNIVQPANLSNIFYRFIIFIEDIFCICSVRFHFCVSLSVSVKNRLQADVIGVLAGYKSQ